MHFLHVATCNLFHIQTSSSLQGRRALLQFEVMKTTLTFRVTGDVQVVEAKRVAVKAEGVEVEPTRVEVDTSGNGCPKE